MRLLLLAIAILATAPATARAQPEVDAAVNRALELILARKPQEAVALLSKTVKKFPNAAAAHERLADAHMAVLEAMPHEGARPSPARRQRLEAAAAHFGRAVELTHVNRAMNLISLVEIYGTTGLSQFAEMEPYARRLVAEHPTIGTGHARLAQVLVETARAAEAATILKASRSAVEADRRGRFAAELWQVVREMPGWGAPQVSVLLDEAMGLVDEAIKTSPKDGELVMLKSSILEEQANRVEQDAGRRTKMLEESRRLWEAGRKLIR